MASFSTSSILFDRFCWCYDAITMLHVSNIVLFSFLQMCIIGIEVEVSAYPAVCWATAYLWKYTFRYKLHSHISIFLKISWFEKSSNRPRVRFSPSISYFSFFLSHPPVSNQKLASESISLSQSAHSRKHFGRNGTNVVVLLQVHFEFFEVKT